MQEPGEVQEPEKGKMEPRTSATRRTNVRYPRVTQPCSFPYKRCYRSHCRHGQNLNNFASNMQNWWLNEFEREKEDVDCISPQVKDSYEMLCSIPVCEDRPSTSINTDPGEMFVSVHCLFCNKSLYRGGTIYDIREGVRSIKTQSNDIGDDIADRIGLRTRITVHKSCFEEYTKIPVAYLKT